MCVCVACQDWIYRQLCETTTPLHTQLLPLIDAYVNSILTPASKTNPEATNQPITEQEILCVFQSTTGVSRGGKPPARPVVRGRFTALCICYCCSEQSQDSVVAKGIDSRIKLAGPQPSTPNL